ncbi:MAG TPA: hypothetical protein VNI01_06970, partial [Elusimicrobiota bacterium]|nr:hypothetical protein [Elusimicrobiota bacterium]
MDSEQLEKELARVWQRVNAASAPWEGGPPAAPESQAPMDAPSIAREASLDAINLIKRQSRGESIRMAQLLELKEKQAAELRARLDAAQTENAALRRRAQREDEIVYDKLQAVSRELEAAREALKAQEESFRAEAESLRGAADGARRQSAAEAARLREMERGWFERERALLLRIAEL